MPQGQTDRLRVAAARADFLENGADGAVGISEQVSASWVRSQSAGVSPESPQADFMDVDMGSRLMRCARPVLTQLETDSADLPLAIALTDSHARVLSRIDVSRAVARLLDRVDFAPGFNYAETSMGTNGVGTVLEAGRSLSIVGPEHFSESLQMFACTGAPIMDPLSGRVEGILDLSTMSESWSPLMHTLVKSAAKDISRNLLLDRSQAQQALFDTYLRVDARSASQAVFAFAESVFMANATAQKMFAPSEQLAIREHAQFVMSRRRQASDTMTLAGGRVVQIRGTRLVAGDETAGIVVVASASDPRDSRCTEQHDQSRFADQLLPAVAVSRPETGLLATELSRPHAPISGGVSASWQRACADLTEALAAENAVIVVGDTGSGKFTLLAELFHAHHPGGRSICIDADQLHSDASTDFSSLLGGSQERTLLILRNIDRADTDGATRLEALLDAVEASSAPVSAAATLSDSSLESDLPFHTLLGHFDTSVDVPPLRCRSEDLPQLVARILTEIAPGRRVRLSPEADRLIAAYSWPRNVTQLREALTHAVRQRPVGEIQARDLPAYCHTAGRKNLSRMEQAERDAIIEALAAHDGNRQAAAAHVGISRSSLYRKLKTYGIRG